MCTHDVQYNPVHDMFDMHPHPVEWQQGWATNYHQGIGSLSSTPICSYAATDQTVDVGLFIIVCYEITSTLPPTGERIWYPINFDPIYWPPISSCWASNYPRWNLYASMTNYVWIESFSSLNSHDFDDTKVINRMRTVYSTCFCTECLRCRESRNLKLFGSLLSVEPHFI